MKFSSYFVLHGTSLFWLSTTFFWVCQGLSLYWDHKSIYV